MDLTTGTLYICIFVVAAAVVYDQLTKKIPSRLRAEEAPRSAFGLVRADTLSSHEHARAHGIDFVFVHGLGSNPDTTWGPKGTNWVSDFLPQDIPAAVHKDVRIFFYNYDSYWKRDAVQTRLSGLAQSLLNHLHSIRRTDEERTRTLIFVGHSYGGLVIKKALLQARTSQSTDHIAENTKAVVFLGTPHRGSSFSTWGGIAARVLRPLGSNQLLLWEIAYDSIALLDLHEEFENAFSDHLEVVNFFERRKTRLLKVWFVHWEAFCVSEQSAKYGKRNVGLDVDHYGLNKFKSTTDDKYKQVRDCLLRLIEPLASQKQQLYSVPIDTVECYTERPELSAAVAEKLRAHHPQANVPYALAIYGLGGSGKTQLALKYVEDHKNEYDPILWIDAKDEESVQASFARCASELKLQIDSSQTQRTSLADSPIVQAVRKWLCNRKGTDDKWLMIVDNADDFTWGIKKVMPKGEQGSIIITSQDSDSRALVNGGCEKLYVGTMKAEEARALILRHLALAPDLVSADNLQQCDTIAERLGYLALAVDLAGAYISNDDMDKTQALGQYLTDYARHQDDLLKSEFYRGLSASDKTIWTVWDTTLEKIEARYAHVRPGLVLAFLAHFKSVVVHDELLRLASLEMSRVCRKLYHGAVELPSWLDKALTVENGEWDDYYYRESRRVLVRYSLLQEVEAEWPGVSMHGLVQWRARKYEEELPWGQWHLMAVVAGCAQLYEEEARPQFRRELVTYLPPVGEAYLDDLEVDDVGMEFVWSTIGRTLNKEGRWNEAGELFVQSIEMGNKSGTDPADILSRMSYLASTYRNQGRWDAAEELELQVLETSKQTLGVDHPDTLSSMGNLASTYWNQGRWDAAEELELQVLETRKQTLGVDHPDTLISMGNLAATYRRQGRWDAAEELELQVLETSKQTLGVDHPDTLISMGNLAATYRSQGRWDAAEELELQVLETSKQTLGVDHPDTLSSMDNLASTYWNQGRWDAAEKLDLQVLETRKQTLGVDHPDTLISMGNLAATYRRQGRWDAAEKLELQVLETRKQTLGVDHPDTLISMNNLAHTWKRQGRSAEALKLMSECVRLSHRVLGVTHPYYLTFSKTLADWEAEQEDE